jgi:hypothetical protein
MVVRLATTWGRFFWWFGCVGVWVCAHSLFPLLLEYYQMFIYVTIRYKNTIKHLHTLKLREKNVAFVGLWDGLGGLDIVQHTGPL